MNSSELYFIDEFKRISGKRWIKSINNSTGSIGLTFEKELGKKPDDTYFPDFYGIEIKCTSRYSRYPLYLFSVAFDGPSFPELDRIVSKYGWPDSDFPNKNVLYTKLYFTRTNLVNYAYRFKLEHDREEEKVFLCVYDLDYNLIERESFIYTQTLYNHLMLKLKEFAHVQASSKQTEDGKYFRYYKFDLYKLMSFERFLILLEQDELTINLISRISKSGVNKGKYKNKNLSIGIEKWNIDKLYTLVYSYNHDEDIGL